MTLDKEDTVAQNHSAFSYRVDTGGILPVLTLQGSSRTTNLTIVDRRIPESGLKMARFTLDANLGVKTVAELGGGKYAPSAIAFVTALEDIKATVVELQLEEAQVLQQQLEANHLADCCAVINGDTFAALRQQSFDLVLSNIAQMPLPEGVDPNPHDHGGEDGWLYLDRIVNESREYIRDQGFLVLTAFDFLGVNRRTGRQPSLYERLARNGWNIHSSTCWQRPIRHNGKTAESLPTIERNYPMARVWHNDRSISVTQATAGDLWPLNVDMWVVLAQRG